MAGITLEGTNGLSPDFQRTLERVAEAERRPVRALEARKAEADKRLELLRDVIGRIDRARSTVEGLGTPAAIRDPIALSSREDILTATADKEKAMFGSHNLEVLQLASPAAAISNGFPDKDQTSVGTGYFSFYGPDGEEREVFVDEDNGTLEGLAGIINSAKLGVRASVTQDYRDAENPYRLVLTHEGTGTPASVEYPVFYFVDGEEELYLDLEKPATNAIIRYEGLEIESPTNEIKDLIPGVTVNLKGMTDPGRPTQLTIRQDIEKTKGKVKEFVEHVNSVFSFIEEQNRTDENTPRGTLAGDYGIRFTQNRLQNALHDNFIMLEGKTIRALSDVGIQFDRKSMLQFDEKKFENALAANFDEVVDLLAGDGRTYGVMPKVLQALDSATKGKEGLLSAQEASARDKARALEKDIQEKEKRLDERVATLREKLHRAQSAIATLERQTAGLSAAANQSPFPMG